MSITHDNTTSVGDVTVSSKTFSHTVANQANRILIVGVCLEYYNISVTSITYAGVSLTKIDRRASASSSGNSAELWYLINPTTGANNVVVNLDGESNVVIGASSYYDVHQTTPLGTAVKATGNSTPATVNASSASGELVVDTVGSNKTLTVGADQTQRWNRDDTDAYRYGGGSSEPGAATVTMSWVLSGSSGRYWNIIAVPLKPTSGAAYSLSCDGGTYTEAGTVAGLRRDGKVAAAAGGYAETGMAALLEKGFKLLAAAGAYVETGIASTLLRDALLSAGAGSYLETGFAVGLFKGRTIAAGIGDFNLDGISAGLLRDGRLIAAAGAYLETGSLAGLLKDSLLAAGPGAYIETGSVAALLRDFLLTALAGSYSWEGMAADLLYAGGEENPFDYITFRRRRR